MFSLIAATCNFLSVLVVWLVCACVLACVRVCVSWIYSRCSSRPRIQQFSSRIMTLGRNLTSKLTVGRWRSSSESLIAQLQRTCDNFIKTRLQQLHSASKLDYVPRINAKAIYHDWLTPYIAAKVFSTYSSHTCGTWLYDGSFQTVVSTAGSCCSDLFLSSYLAPVDWLAALSWLLCSLINL